ncbi:putative alpha/beta hydrolase [Plasmodium gaboni]|uniref:Putative alpha/beta hydrolase n=1 Tax=Plasmodium gaboni TaxID=647221 RepID=A0A151L9T4_9APIC|nr:putative alpha/beta hydrolase [Plasmodium gaboni]KYN95712.1 putative alpha/beta hydrolase [Plasmodium gaboni]
MYSQYDIEYEYVTCTKGYTFILYSPNLFENVNAKKSDSTSPYTENNKEDEEEEEEQQQDDINNENIIVLFLHGLNGNSYQFENVFYTLIHFNYKFISLDFYGHGNSSLLQNVNKFTEKLFIEQIYDVLKKKNIFNSNFVVIGFSMGCIIAAHLSVDNKLKIKKYCLISAAGLAKPRHRFLHFLLKHNIRLCLRVAKRYSYLFVNEEAFKNEYNDIQNNAYYSHNRYSVLKENHEKFIETFLKVLTGTKIQDSKKYYSAFLKKNSDVLFIYGRDDDVTPCAYTIKFLEKQKKYINNVKLIIFPECSHLVLTEKPYELVQHIIYFLQNKYIYNAEKNSDDI